MRLAPCLPLLVAACAAAPEPPAGLPDAAPASGLRDVRRAVALALPPDLQVAEEHFSRAAPPNKLRDTYVMTSRSGAPVLTLDVWDNPRGLPLDAWFDETLPFMRAPGATIVRGTATARALPALAIDLPGGFAPPQRAAIFAAGARVFRLTCHDRDDPAALATFDRALQTFDGVAP